MSILTKLFPKNFRSIERTLEIKKGDDPDVVHLEEKETTLTFSTAFEPQVLRIRPEKKEAILFYEEGSMEFEFSFSQEKIEKVVLENYNAKKTKIYKRI